MGGDLVADAGCVCGGVMLPPTATAASRRVVMMAHPRGGLGRVQRRVPKVKDLLLFLKFGREQI